MPLNPTSSPPTTHIFGYPRRREGDYSKFLPFPLHILPHCGSSNLQTSPFTSFSEDQSMLRHFQHRESPACPSPASYKWRRWEGRGPQLASFSLFPTRHLQPLVCRSHRQLLWRWMKPTKLVRCQPDTSKAPDPSPATTTSRRSSVVAERRRTSPMTHDHWWSSLGPLSSTKLHRRGHQQPPLQRALKEEGKFRSICVAGWVVILAGWISFLKLIIRVRLCTGFGLEEMNKNGWVWAHQMGSGSLWLRHKELGKMCWMGMFIAIKLSLIW